MAYFYNEYKSPLFDKWLYNEYLTDDDLKQLLIEMNNNFVDFFFDRLYNEIFEYLINEYKHRIHSQTFDFL